MQSDPHERARFLIDESRVAGISQEDAAWLRSHTGECAVCARHEEATESVLRALNSYSFDFAPRGVCGKADRPLSSVGRAKLAWRWSLAVAALVVLAAVPVYKNIRAARQERADALLLEGVESRVSRTVPAAMEPLVQPQLGEFR